MNIKIISAISALFLVSACGDGYSIRTPPTVQTPYASVPKLTRATQTAPVQAVPVATVQPSVVEQLQQYTPPPAQPTPPVQRFNPQDTSNGIPAMYSRAFQCDNGMNIHTTELGDSSLGVYVISDPRTEASTAILVNIGQNSYTSRTGVFGNGSAWKESGNSAKFTYGNSARKEVATTCQRV